MFRHYRLTSTHFSFAYELCSADTVIKERTKIACRTGGVAEENVGRNFTRVTAREV